MSFCTLKGSCVAEGTPSTPFKLVLFISQHIYCYMANQRH
jgi:hypothetical protein